MKKKLFCLVAVLVLALSLPVPAMAVDSGELDFITDAADLLSQNEWDALNDKAQEISDEYLCAVYVVTVEDYYDYGDTPEEACDNIYRDYDLGRGTDGDAVVLLLSMDDRDFALMDYGEYGQYAFTDYGFDTVEDAMLDNFGDDDWYGGFSDYLEQCAVILESEKNGRLFDEPVARRAVRGYGIALTVGIVVAFIVCSIFKSQMKTAVKATEADHYVAPGGVDMRIREDRFTHTTRVERKIEEENSGSSSGGGSSGRSGKF